MSEQGPIKRRVTGEEGCSNKITVEQEEPPNNMSENHESCDWISFSLRSRILPSCFRREDTSAVHALHDTSDKRATEPKGNEFYIFNAVLFLPFHCEMKLIETVMHF